MKCSNVKSLLYDKFIELIWLCLQNDFEIEKKIALEPITALWYAIPTHSLSKLFGLLQQLEKF